MLLLQFAQESGRGNCFRCGQRIEGVDDLSIEHKAPWQSAPDPKANFFNLENIAFSHLRCNTLAGGAAWQKRKTKCPSDHLYTKQNTIVERDGHRRCKTCHYARTRERRRRVRAVA